MIEGIVISLEILVIEMGDRGSKSDSICKRATSRRFFKIYLFRFCKVYSGRRESRLLGETK